MIRQAQKEKVREFAAIAESVCRWIEDVAAAPKKADLSKGLFLLTELHFRILSITDFRSDSDVEADEYSNEKWSKLFHKLSKLPVTTYWEVFNTHQLSPEDPMKGNLADDLADIHRDLMRGLSLFHKNEIGGAAFEWRTMYEAHWGHHLIDAERAIHHFSFTEHFCAVP